MQFLELAGDMNIYLKFMSEKGKFNFVGGIADPQIKDLDVSKYNLKKSYLCSLHFFFVQN